MLRRKNKQYLKDWLAFEYLLYSFLSRTDPFLTRVSLWAGFPVAFLFSKFVAWTLCAYETRVKPSPQPEHTRLIPIEHLWSARMRNSYAAKNNKIWLPIHQRQQPTSQEPHYGDALPPCFTMVLYCSPWALLTVLYWLSLRPSKKRLQARAKANNLCLITHCSVWGG